MRQVTQKLPPGNCQMLSGQQKSIRAKTTCGGAVFGRLRGRAKPPRPLLTQDAKKAHIVFVRLESDPDKETINLAKHGVDFSTVQKVFHDPQRMIVPNETHSSDEPRFYAVGHDGHGVLTVRFTLRGDAIRVIGAGYWRQQKRAYEDQKKENELR